MVERRGSVFGATPLDGSIIPAVARVAFGDYGLRWMGAFQSFERSVP